MMQVMPTSCAGVCSINYAFLLTPFSFYQRGLSLEPREVFLSSEAGFRSQQPPKEISIEGSGVTLTRIAAEIPWRACYRRNRCEWGSMTLLRHYFLNVSVCASFKNVQEVELTSGFGVRAHNIHYDKNPRWKLKTFSAASRQKGRRFLAYLKIY